MMMTPILPATSSSVEGLSSVDLRIFWGGNRDGGRPEFRAPFEKLVDEQCAIRHRIRFGRPWDQKG